jgi:BCD family chlorophyll transporter-like MFS transporter
MPQRSIALSWVGILRLGLVQASLGAMVVFVTSTLNRVMVVEYALPALLPGALVALHYTVQLLRPRYGYESDRRGRRTPFVLGGMAGLALCTVLCAFATTLMPTSPVYGVTLAVIAYLAFGAAVGAAGTSLLVLLACQVDERRRAASATVMWILMVAGFAISSTMIGHFLDPYSPQRLLKVAMGTAMGAFALACVALFGIENGTRTAAPAAAAGAAHQDFGPTLRRVWSEPEARRFTLFVFLSMLAYSAQELLLEPFAGLLMNYSVGASAKLSGLQHGAVFVGMLGVGFACSGKRRFGSLRAWTIGGCLGSCVALLSLLGAVIDGPAWPLQASIVALGISNGVFAVSAIGSMMELAHRGGGRDAGVRMGLWGAAQALAFALGGLLSTSIVDAVRYLFGAPLTAFGVVFCLEAALFLLAAGFVLRPREAPVPGITSEPV